MDMDMNRDWNSKIPLPVKKIIRKLDKAGFEAYIVGGCVRDMILGRVPHDWDITTNATPDQILAVFKDNKCFEIGKKHGTISVMMNDEQFEVTTYRIDGTYSDNRRPDSVKFTSNLLDDLQRRDFTMNAMAYKPEDGVGLVDPYNGVESLSAGVISCVGNPNNRFAEDGLRILRALRFAAQLGFVIDKNTSDSIHKKKYLIDKISEERINAELTKILMSNHCGVPVLREYSDVIAQVVPDVSKMIGFEQMNPYHEYDVWEHTLHSLNAVPDEADLYTRLAILFHDIGKPNAFSLDKDDDTRGHFYGHPAISGEIAHSILINLKFSNDIIDKVTQLVNYHDISFYPTEKSIKRILNKIGIEQFQRLLIIRECDIKGKKSNYDKERVNGLGKYRDILSNIIEQESCFQLKDLAINGEDLLDIGIPEGKMIGKILNICLSYVIEGIVDNTKDSLMVVARGIIDTAIKPE